jgi:hypothetical protein
MLLMAGGIGVTLLTGMGAAQTFIYGASGEIVSAEVTNPTGRPIIKYQIREASGDVLQYSSASGLELLPAGLSIGTIVEKQPFTFSYRIDGREQAYPWATRLVSLLPALTGFAVGFGLWRNSSRQESV